MRAVLQRVRAASVTVGDRTVGAIAHGVLAFVGVGADDARADVDYIASKIRDIRMFEDEAGKMNRSVVDAGGRVLVVSQFTLYADCRKGRRPSFDRAAPPEIAEPLYDALVCALQAYGVEVETGVFRADMQVASINDGPITILLDSSRLL